MEMMRKKIVNRRWTVGEKIEGIGFRHMSNVENYVDKREKRYMYTFLDFRRFM